MVMRIKELRSACGLTQCQLADKMGVCQNCISGWESEVALPRARDIPRLAAVLGCSIGDLFEEQPCPAHMEMAVDL